MAEERNLATARATETDDEESTKEDLQRRMEEARESITQTVTEIKDSVVNQYQSVKESVSDALDWREQYRRRPVAWSVGAASAGFLLGYGIAGAFKGDRSDRDDYPSYDESDAFATTGTSLAKYPSRRDSSAADASRSYAAQAVTGGSYSSSEYAPLNLSRAADASAARDYSRTTQAEEADKPGLIDRFKETRAYDRLQSEVSNLGSRAMDELATTAQSVVLPAIFAKIKDLIGVNLSGTKPARTSSSAPRAAASSTAAASTGTATSSGGGSSSRATGGNPGASYGTSENRDYGSPSRES